MYNYNPQITKFWWLSLWTVIWNLLEWFFYLTVLTSAVTEPRKSPHCPGRCCRALWLTHPKRVALMSSSKKLWHGLNPVFHSVLLNPNFLLQCSYVQCYTIISCLVWHQCPPNIKGMSNPTSECLLKAVWDVYHQISLLWREGTKVTQVLTSGLCVLEFSPK